MIQWYLITWTLLHRVVIFLMLIGWYGFFWRNACLKGWQVMSLEVLNMDLLLLISLISDYEAFLWSSLERLKTIRYFNQNTTAHGGKCGSYGQGCDLTVSTTISYFIALFPALHIDWWPVMVKFFIAMGVFCILISLDWMIMKG